MKIKLKIKSPLFWKRLSPRARLYFQLFLGAAIVILLPLAIMSFQQAGKAEASWFNDQWGFRKEIPVSAHTAAENNVYISVTLDSSDTTRFKSNCGDLRFTDNSGKLLPYYISSGCGGATTVVHVFLQSFPAGAQTFYYYYGNPSASSGQVPSDFATQAANYTVGTLGTEEVGKAPVAYWKFDEGTGTTATDSTTKGYNGTIGSTLGTDAGAPTWATEDQCVSEKCLSFDGTNDAVDFGDYDDRPALKFDTGNWSVSTWFRATSTGTKRVIFGLRTGSDQDFNVGLSTDNKPYIEWVSYPTHADYSTTKGPSAITDEKWHQIGAKREGSTITLYFDGLAVATDATVGTYDLTGPSWFSRWTAGAWFNGCCGTVDAGVWQYFFKGYIDDVKIYNYARTAAQIKTDYASRGSVKGVSASLGRSNLDQGSTLAQGLVGYWKQDEATWSGTLNEVVDSSGNGNHGTAQGPAGDKAYPTAGKFGNSGYFDGNGAYVSVPDNDSLDIGSSEDFTLSLWFKTTDPSTSIRGLVTKTASNQVDTVGYALRINNTNNIRFSVKDNSSNSISDQFSGGTMNNGNWHLIAMVFKRNDSKGFKIYLDGSQIGSSYSTTAITDTLANASALQIGNVSAYWNGSIDETRLYKRALSPAEVSQLYNWAPGPQVYYKFEEGSGTTTVNDTSGNGNNGTINGTVTNANWVPGKYGKSYDFNGTDEFVKTPGLSFIGSSTSEFTVSGWINPRVTAGTIFHNYNPSGWSTGLVGFTGGKLSFNIYNLGFVTETGTTPINSWTYVSLTRDGSGNNKLYKNGVLVASNNGGYSSSGGANEIGIGRYRADCCQFDSPGWFNGKVDEFKVYNYARTAKQIVSDMNAGHPSVGSPVGSALGYWKMDEGYGTAANNSGSGGMSLNGTLGVGSSAPQWTTNGKFGKGLVFDGSNDNVSFPDTGY